MMIGVGASMAATVHPDRAAPARVAVLVACYNRCEITLDNLGHLIEALDSSGIDADIFLLDDGSPDRTGNKVASEYPQIKITIGEGNLFWNRGMHRIYTVARQYGPFDGYLLFNDDVRVNPFAVRQFLSLWQRLNTECPTTLVGSTHATGGTQTTYSAFWCPNRFRPLTLELIEPNETTQPADTFNANFVIVPGKTFDRLGGTDPVYWHSFGDIDLGYRISAGQNDRVLLAPGWIGACDGRPAPPPSDQPLLRRIRNGFSGLNDARQPARIIWRFAPNRFLAIGIILAMLVKRLSLQILNRQDLWAPAAKARIRGK